jgi:hypothetical protein
MRIASHRKDRVYTCGSSYVPILVSEKVYQEETKGRLRMYKQTDAEEKIGKEEDVYLQIRKHDLLSLQGHYAVPPSSHPSNTTTLSLS